VGECRTAAAIFEKISAQSADTKLAVRPTDTPSACAMGTSAVAISELFTGLSVELTNSGVTNRHENASPCRPAPDSTAAPAAPCAPGPLPL